ncbi:MAG: selenocysteine-specific translation elongation factor [Bacillota bacterium]
MKNLIIGTAGHVDHGKTMLVKALTGKDTDRLKEERERGISIELGFADLELPGGKKAGIIDVPGHERFIKNMLAGVGGIDIVMLVIAADEGVMPQTREHLDIIQLLQVSHGIVVITKIDSVDREWMGLVREEIGEFLKGTVLEGAPVVEVSSVTGQGIDTLKRLLSDMADRVERKASSGAMRLPVDRVFTVPGFGTVVTGTLISGRVSPGDHLEIMPRGIGTRVRNIHVHGQKVEEAGEGQRVALNLAGVEAEQVTRGNVVCAVGTMRPTFRMDVRIQLLDSAKPLKNRARVRLYLGTAEIFGRVVLLEEEVLEPGKWMYAQLELEEEAVASRGDRFVIRSYSPMRTIGGGSVIDTAPKKHKRFRKSVIESIAIKERGTPGELIGQVFELKPGMYTAAELEQATGLDGAEIRNALDEMEREGAVLRLEGEGAEYYLTRALYLGWGDEIKAAAQKFHREYPLREGLPKEELRSKRFGGLTPRQFQALLQRLEKEGTVATGASVVFEPGFACEPGPGVREKIESIESGYRSAAMQPPAWSEMSSKSGINGEMAGEALHYLLRKGVLIKVAEDLYFHKEALAAARKRLAEFFGGKGEISVGEARDLFETSRKYTLPVLEYFDREKVTRRTGDLRVPGREMK